MSSALGKTLQNAKMSRHNDLDALQVVEAGHNHVKGQASANGLNDGEGGTTRRAHSNYQKNKHEQELSSLAITRELSACACSHDRIQNWEGLNEDPCKPMLIPSVPM